MPKLETLQPIAGRVIDQYTKSGLPGLSPQDQTFYLTWAYSALLANGGHPAFFYNSGADHFTETVAALRALTLSSHAEWLEEAATLLFGADVPPDMMARSEQLDELDDDPALDERLESLDEEFFSSGGDDAVLDALEAFYFGRAA